MAMHFSLTSDTQSATTDEDDRKHFDCFHQTVLFLILKLSVAVEVLLLKCQNKSSKKSFAIIVHV